MKAKELMMEGFLNTVPERSIKITWTEDRKGIVTLIILKNRLVRAIRSLTKKPEEITITLDRNGSFIWKNINGKNDFRTIAKSISCKYGNTDKDNKKLFKYAKLLKRNRFITFK